jgi:hypothetical protein
MTYESVKSKVLEELAKKKKAESKANFIKNMPLEEMIRIINIDCGEAIDLTEKLTTERILKIIDDKMADIQKQNEDYEKRVKENEEYERIMDINDNERVLKVLKDLKSKITDQEGCSKSKSKIGDGRDNK